MYGFTYVIQTLAVLLRLHLWKHANALSVFSASHKEERGAEDFWVTARSIKGSYPEMEQIQVNKFLLLGLP